MSRESLVKIANVDVPASRRQGGALRVLIGPASTGARDGFLATLTLRPHESMSEHYHPHSDEFLYVVRGRVVVRDEDGPVLLESDEATMLPRGRRHRFENAGATDAFCVIAICPLAPRPELGHVDTEAVPRGDEPPPRIGAVS